MRALASHMELEVECSRAILVQRVVTGTVPYIRQGPCDNDPSFLVSKTLVPLCPSP